MIRVRQLLRLAALGAVLVYAAPAPAQTIIDEWSSVKAPPAPALKSVTVDPKTTALLMMDIIKQTCNTQSAPTLRRLYSQRSRNSRRGPRQGV